jgi:hypothetical protein
MGAIKTCIICGNQFTQRNPPAATQTFCSYACHLEAAGIHIRPTEKATQLWT